MINVIINGASAVSENNVVLTSERVGLHVKFTFDAAWDGLNVKAVFSGSGVTVSVPLLGATETDVPWEVMVQPYTRLRIGAEGRSPDGTVVIPTTWASIGTILPGATATDELAKPPTPTAFDRIMSVIGNMDDLATAAKDSLVAAINEAMEKGGGEIDPEAVQQIVEAYLAANPPKPGAEGRGIASIQRTAGDGSPGTSDTYTIAYTDGGTDAITVYNGKDGITPTIGENGNWYLGDTDTGKPSRGAPGLIGATPNIQIGTVETLPAGSPATASMGGTPENPTLNLGIPQGKTGDAGKSAYQYAQDGGYTGTEAEFAHKLAEEMPDKLPNPQVLTFTGAVTGSYDGSEALTVEIPSGGGGSGGSATPYYKVVNMKTTEETKMISIPLSAEAIAKLNAAEEWVLAISMNVSGSTNTETSLGTLTASTYTTWDTNIFFRNISAAVPTTGVDYAKGVYITAIYRRVDGGCAITHVNKYVTNYAVSDATTKAITAGRALDNDKLKILGSINLPVGTNIALYAVGVKEIIDL